MKEHFLEILRDRTSDCLAFRSAAIKLSKLMASEIHSQIPLQSTRVVLIPILRAGLVLLPAFQEIFDSAPIGMVGIRRDENTALPRLYYENLPSLTATDQIFILDPMLATGGSANLTLDRLTAHGASPARTTLITVLTAPEGLAAVKKRYPRVGVYSVAIDKKLDAKKYIVPGLGDFGDRYFGTD